MNPALAQRHQGRLSAVSYPQGSKNGADMHLCGSFRDSQFSTNLLGRLAFHKAKQDLLLAWRDGRRECRLIGRKPAVRLYRGLLNQQRGRGHQVLLQY